MKMKRQLLGESATQQFPQEAHRKKSSVLRRSYYKAGSSSGLCCSHKLRLSFLLAKHQCHLLFTSYFSIFSSFFILSDRIRIGVLHADKTPVQFSTIPHLLVTFFHFSFFHPVSPVSSHLTVNPNFKPPCRICFCSCVCVMSLMYSEENTFSV